MVFNFGFMYGKAKKQKGRLITFIFGHANLAIYLSKKTKHHTSVSVSVFKNVGKVHKMLEHKYYAKIRDLDTFSEIWFIKGVLFSFNSNDICSVDEIA